MRPPPAPERAWAMLSDCWVADVGAWGARPLVMVALEGNWAVDVEDEEESRSPAVGAGAVVFVSDIPEVVGLCSRITLDCKRRLVKFSFAVGKGSERACNC